jgi:hypothetical protein
MTDRIGSFLWHCGRGPEQTYPQDELELGLRAAIALRAGNKWQARHALARVRAFWLWTR